MRVPQQGSVSSARQPLRFALSAAVPGAADSSFMSSLWSATSGLSRSWGAGSNSNSGAGGGSGGDAQCAVSSVLWSIVDPATVRVFCDTPPLDVEAPADSTLPTQTLLAFDVRFLCRSGEDTLVCFKSPHQRVSPLAVASAPAVVAVIAVAAVDACVVVYHRK